MDQRLSEYLEAGDEDNIEDEDMMEWLVRLGSPRLGSTKNGSEDMRPTLLRLSSEAPVILKPFFGVEKKSFLSTNGLDDPVPRGSRSLNKEERS